MKKNKILHISIIIIGIIFILIPIFHTNLWFDESYSVAISNHKYIEIWSIGKNDVHPVLYYWILHTINLIFGSNILLYRIFSALCIAILGIVGYTHIRKDFGEKTGIIFTVLTFFFPVNVVYAGEIRMYSFAMLIVTLMSIYAYRIYINKDKKQYKNWALFGIFSLASAYTHYYGLMIAGLENLFLFIILLIQSKKERKITNNLKAFIITAIPQIILYLPWIMALLKQMEGVSKGFWINIHFPGTFYELFVFPFTGNLENTTYVIVPLALICSLLVWIYMIYLHIKNKNEIKLKPAKISIIFWIMIVLSACLISIIIHRPIIYARYLLCIGGLFTFFIALSMSISGNQKINIIVLTVLITLSFFAANTLIEENYGKEDKEFKNYISHNIQDGDIFICSNEGSGFVISAMYPNNKLYFYDIDNWNVGPAYKAYGDTVYNVDFLKDYSGRIWLINTNHYSLYEKIRNEYDLKLIEQKAFSVEYKKYQYTLTLVEK